MKITGRVIAAMTSVLVLRTTAAEYTLPTQWRGNVDGKKAGNPLVVNGRPRWRADVLTEDEATADAYRAMSWNKVENRWRGDDGGAVFLSKDGSQAWLGASMSKTTSKPVSGALVFIAPASGVYVLSARIVGRPWNSPPNQLAGRLTVVKFSKAVATREVLTAIPLKTEPADLRVETELAEGDELILTQTGIGRGTGSNAALIELKIIGP